MSDKEDEEQPPEKPFYADRATTGRAGCKKCKQKIAKGELRFGKLGYNPFGTGMIKLWHHIPCVFEVFKKQRPTTRKIESPDDISGWDNLSKDDKQEIMSYFSPELKQTFENFTDKGTTSVSSKSSNDGSENLESHKDNSLRAFRKLCRDLSNDTSYLGKTKIISDFFSKSTDDSSSKGLNFKGDIELWCKLLLPSTIVRVYNLQNKQLVKLFSRILGTDHKEMLEDLEKGDVAETICTFFRKSKTITPSSKSTLSLQKVDEFLEILSQMTKEEEQMQHFAQITKKCTENDLKTILRLIKHDLRINAGPKHILEGLHKDAYKAFQTCRDLKKVVNTALKAREKEKAQERGVNSTKGMAISITMMTPVLPMLAKACKSVEMALKSCPNGMYSEIKYDGERVQVHKQGDTFKFFSRSLKPVLSHKVAHFKKYIPEAFPHGADLILDAEILMVDKSGKPLPFGTLGIHKKNEFEDANVCLFVFDCMYYNGQSLLDTPIKERKSILKKNMVEVKNRIMFSEMEEIHRGEDLAKMISKVLKEGLEGLVLKDLKSAYEPGKRHWLKVKKDYLFGGAIADTADLVVLGAWFGSGSKGGIMSSFLMGCYDSKTKKWMTVTKVSNGHDDQTLERIQRELDMVKISKDSSKVPTWLNCTKIMTPDFVAADPKKMPVWEITGAEFTRNQVHTADGISIRFPRVTKIRDDKDWTTATNLEELKNLYKMSKTRDDVNFKELMKTGSGNGSSENSPKAKKRMIPNGGSVSKKAKVDEDENVYTEETSADTNTDTSTEGESDKPDIGVTNLLPNIFTDCVIQIPKHYNYYNLLRRYIIAYDGVMYDREKGNAVENGTEKVSHVIHLNRSTAPKREKFWAKDVKHVRVNWLWDSIKLLEKQPESRYVVTFKNVD